MKVIQLSHPHQIPRDELRETIAAIGFFDGIHLGHRAVIEEAISLAKREGKQSAVISFHPHPSVVLSRGRKEVRYITTLEEKKEILASMGIDCFYIITFDDAFSKLSPAQFIQHFITGLHITHLVAGFDYTFGHKGAGNMENIEQFSNGSFRTTVVEKKEYEGEKISSTRIRQLLQQGEVDQLPALLGRVYQASGEVVAGDNRGGSQLGFPTANIHIDGDKFLPKQGVYAVKVRHGDQFYAGMANLGVVPTFTDGRQEPKLEVNIFDFNEDIYGEVITVEWYQFIREEKKFAGIDEIVAQLKNDEARIRAYFA